MNHCADERYYCRIKSERRQKSTEDLQPAAQQKFHYIRYSGYNHARFYSAARTVSEFPLVSGKFGFGIAFGESRLPAAVISRKEEAEKSILQEGVYIFSKSVEGRQYDT